MALIIADRVQETTTTSGTGTISLAGASTQYRTFVSGIGNNNTTYYCIQSGNNTDWEVGIGTVTDGTPDTLSRDTILASSNAGSAISLTGTSTVFCTMAAHTGVSGLSGVEMATSTSTLWSSTTAVQSVNTYSVADGDVFEVAANIKRTSNTDGPGVYLVHQGTSAAIGVTFQSDGNLVINRISGAGAGTVLKASGTNSLASQASVIPVRMNVSFSNAEYNLAQVYGMAGGGVNNSDNYVGNSVKVAILTGAVANVRSVWLRKW